MALYTNIIKKNTVNNTIIKKYRVEAFDTLEIFSKGSNPDEKEKFSSSGINRAKEEEIIEKALEEAEQIKKRARTEGYEEGFEQGTSLGYEEGYNKAMEDVQAQKEGATELLLQAEKKRKEQLINLEDEIIEMAIMIAQKITKISIDDNDKKIMPMIKSVLNELVNRERMIIRVNAENLEILNKNEEELRKICPNAIFTFLEDNSLDTTNCIIDSEIEQINLDTKSQIDNIIKEFSKVR
ncbi:FliH/SctL family protein [Clostridium sp. DL1XJH146]